MRVSIAVSVVSLALLAAEMPTPGQDGPPRKTEKTRAAPASESGVNLESTIAKWSRMNAKH